MRHLLDIADLSVGEIGEMTETAEDIIKNPEKYMGICKGKKLATLFFEPSTRTRLSFEAAMIDLGGQVIGFESGTNSSASKGESVRDTARVVGNYADIIAMRHPSEGAAFAAAEVSPVPIINAGDGGHCHPTQTLADILTIKREAGRLDNLTIGLCGDLKYGRTVHSLIEAMIRYKNVSFVLISPEELALPDYMLDVLDENGAEYKITESLDRFMPNLDVLYMTRIQKERFDDLTEYERLKDSYVLTNEKLICAKKNMIILHPLPRVNEISPEVDSDPRAAYFRQTYNGKIMRMALIIKLLDCKNVKCGGVSKKYYLGYKCKNKKCITQTEYGLTEKNYIDKNGLRRCAYCDSLI